MTASLWLKKKRDEYYIKKQNKRIDEIIAQFAKEGPSATNMAKVKEYMIKKYKENLRDNGYYSKAMVEYLTANLDVCTDYEKVLNSITAKDVKASVANLIKQKNHIKIVMVGKAK